MRAMTMQQPRGRLECLSLPRPTPGPGELLIKVAACGVCRTDLHEISGELPWPGHPIVPGHEIVGHIEAVGDEAGPWRTGDRVGVPWLGWTCGLCDYCRSNRENLCPNARFTGYQLAGGYADYAVADARYVLPIPSGYSDVAAAPLLCAGLIGFRALRMAGPAPRLGLFGFGASAHIVAQVALQQGREILAFTRPGDAAAQDFARSLGASWAGDTTEAPPAPLDAAILFAPAGELVPRALELLKPGGIVVCAGIHMSDIPAFPYRLLWQERSLRSVANLTRADGLACMEHAAKHHIHTHTVTYDLDQANAALEDLRGGRFQGAAVLVP